MKPVGMKFSWSIPIGFALVALLLVIAFVVPFLLSVVVIAFGIILVFLIVASARNRPVPEPLCPLCRYSMQGLSEPICPECGGDFRNGRPNGLSEGRRRVQACFAAFLVACLGLFLSSVTSYVLWNGISSVVGWPTYWMRGERDYDYRIHAVGPEYVSDRSPLASFRSGERLLVRVHYDTYEQVRDGVILGTVEARFMKDAVLRASPRGRGLANSAWFGEVELSFDPATKWITILSDIDPGAILDAALDKRLVEVEAEPDGIDPMLLGIIEDPVIRQGLKEQFATGWVPGRVSQRAGNALPVQPLLGVLERGGFPEYEREPGVRLENAGGGSSSRGGSGLFPIARTGYIVTMILGWFITAFTVAAVLRWYGRPRPSLGLKRFLPWGRSKSAPVQ